MDYSCNMWMNGHLSLSIDFVNIVNNYYKIIPWSRLTLDKLMVAQLMKKFLVIYGTRKFMVVFTKF